MATSKKTTETVRAPRDIMARLRKQLPETHDSERIRTLYSLSAFRVDDVLGQPFIKPKSINKILNDVKKKK